MRGCIFLRWSSRIVQSLVLSLCLSLISPLAVFAQSRDEATLRTFVEGFFEALRNKDLDALRLFWSDNSRDFTTRKAGIAEEFSDYRNVEPARLEFRKLLVSGNTAIIRVGAAMNIVPVLDGQRASGKTRVDRTFHCIKEAGHWRVLTFEPSEHDYATELLAASPEERRNSLLASNSELITPTLGTALISKGTVLMNRGDYPGALAASQLANNIAERLNDKSGVSVALGLAANIHNLQANYVPALDLAGRSLSAANETRSAIRIALARNLLGQIHRSMGNNAEAVPHVRAALESLEALGNKSGLAAASNNMGFILIGQGEYPQGRVYLERARVLATDADDKATLARVLNNLGNLENHLGNYEPALKYYKASLQAKEELGLKSELAPTLVNIGLAYELLGDRIKALDFYQRGKKLAEELGQKQTLGLALGNIGELYRGQGNTAQALDYFKKCLDLNTKIGNQRERARMLNSIGIIYTSQKNIAEVLRYYNESLQIMKELGDREAEAAALNNIAAAYAEIKEIDKALAAYHESLRIKRELGNKSEISRVLSNIGGIYLNLQDYPKALDLLDEALVLSKAVGAWDVYREACVRAGHAYGALRQWDRAAQKFDEAIESIESGRKEVVGGEEDGQLFFENNITPYGWMVGALVKQNRYREALQYAERAQGRVVLDVLRSGKVNVTKAMSADEQERERQLNHQLISLNAQLLQTRQASLDPAPLALLETEIRKARLEYESFHTGLYAAHPDLKVQRGEVEPFRIEDAATLIGQSDRALLEFVALKDETLLFVLTPASPSDSGENNRNIDFRLYTIDIKQQELADLVTRFREILSKRGSGFQELGKKLFDLLLGPARQQLGSSKELVIVPGGPLWELPFQALQSASGKYVIEDFALSYVPSLSVLREMRKQRQKRAESAPPLHSLLAFGNPAVGNRTSAKVETRLIHERLGPLLEAERQARILGRLYGPGSKIYLGPAAGEERLKAEAGNCRVLHLATHGILNDANPMYSQVVLSQTAVGESEDGLLESWEIMTLDLKADLVVLSACETARGQIREGEGLVGLSWALFVAGAPTAVVSQWKVEAISTTNLMIAFHGSLVASYRKTAGRITKAEALRQAAFKLLRSKRYNHPFYWAPFVLIGDGG